MAISTTDSHVLKSPLWLLAVRGAQIVISIVVLGLAARLVTAAPLDEWGLAVATVVITWIIVAYALVTELVPSAQPLYHIIAVLSLDAFLLVLWLATWAANAAARGRFYVSTGSSRSCWRDGTCFSKRDITLYQSGADMMAAVAGLGALVWLLFIASFVWTLLMYLRGRKDGRFPLVLASTQETTQGPQQQQQVYQMEEAQPKHNAQATANEQAPADSPKPAGAPLNHDQHWPAQEPVATSPAPNYAVHT